MKTQNWIQNTLSAKPQNYKFFGYSIPYVDRKYNVFKTRPFRIVFCVNTDTGMYGASVCHPNDSFSKMKGRAIAQRRLQKEEACVAGEVPVNKNHALSLSVQLTGRVDPSVHEGFLKTLLQSLGDQERYVGKDFNRSIDYYYNEQSVSQYKNEFKDCGHETPKMDCDNSSCGECKRCDS